MFLFQIAEIQLRMEEEFVDLKTIVEKQAWDMYEDRRPKKFPKNRKDVTMNIDWSKVTFKAEDPDYEPIGADQYSTNVIFKSVFENKSAKPQTHILKAERQTVSECKCTMSKGITTGGECGLEISAPGEIAKASVGFSKGIEVQDSTESTNQKTLTWSTEGNITVDGKSTLTAEIHIKEKQCEYKFTSRVRVSGIVAVNFYSRKDNNKYLMAFTGDMCTILLADKSIKDLKTKGNAAILEIAGKCDFKYGIEQQIVVS